MPFPQPFLDALVERNPIEEVVGQYVTLTRKGSNLFGLCPFHSEKTGSFSVAPEKGIYYCFGCHKGGGVINFIMEIESLSYPDAVRLDVYKRQRLFRSASTGAAKAPHPQPPSSFPNCDRFTGSQFGFRGFRRATRDLDDGGQAAS